MLPCHPQVWFSSSERAFSASENCRHFGYCPYEGIEVGASFRNRECNHQVTWIFSGRPSALSDVAESEGLPTESAKGRGHRSRTRIVNKDREPGVIMQKLATVFDFLFGCHHSNLSRVFTIRRQPIACAATVEPRSSIHSRRCPSSAGFPKIPGWLLCGRPENVGRTSLFADVPLCPHSGTARNRA